jgi:uncharacterized protein (DUF58 family)
MAMTARYDRWFCWLLLAAGGASLGVGGYAYLAAPPGSLLQAETEIEIAGAAAGEKRAIAVHFENRSGRPMRILGMMVC